jgi:VirB8 protein
MMTSMVRTDDAALARPKYYEMDGALRANANRAWLLAFLTIPIALLAIGFAVFVRLQPPTVIRIGPNGDVSALGKPAKGAVTDLATGGTDQFLDEAFVKRFLTSYLNYSPADVDDHWANSLNMMTRNLRAYTLKAMADDNTRGKIDDGQIQSAFHLREIETVGGEPLTYLVYGVKDVHHLANGTETTDHFVNEYRVRLIADKRSDVNPDGLWIAEYSERPIDGERRDRILNARDAVQESDADQNRGGQ